MDSALDAPNGLALDLALDLTPVMPPAVARSQPHIVHVATRLPDGALAFVVRVIAELDELGFKQTLVLMPPARQPDPTSVLPARVGRIALPRHGWRPLGRARVLSGTLCDLLAGSVAPIVHLHAARTGMLERVVLAALRGRAACLYTPYDAPLLDPSRRLARAVSMTTERLAGLLPLAAVGRSVGEARLLARACRRPVYVLEKPVETPYLDAQAREEQPAAVIAVGRPVAHNRPELFARLALRFEIDELATRFVWIGDGDEAREALLRAAGVSLTARAAVHDMAARLARASVFVQTSHRDGPPLALLRAMAIGLPCVAADTATHRDLIVHGRTGFIARDLDDFDRHVRWLLEDAPLRRRVGAAARQEARNRFAPERFRLRLQLLYATARAAYARQTA